MKIKFDWFLAGMAIAVGLAAFFPDPGARGGWMHAELLNKVGIALILFLHGVALSFAALKAGTLNWRLHLVVQSATFLLFPMLGVGLFLAARSWVSPDLALGLFFLCALPSTVSSSVALTAAAKGNVAGAVFNATLSSLLGILLTPLWVSVMANTGDHHSISLGKVVLDLVLWLLLPLALGQLSRPLLAKPVGKHKARINVVDRFTILVLVYTSFCDSMKAGVWSGHGLSTIIVSVIASLAVFYTVMGILKWVTTALRFTWPDQIAALFCGSKKTLASGIPMAQLMFGTNPAISLILLPIMIYHPLQLIICGSLAGRWARRTQAGELESSPALPRS